MASLGAAVRLSRSGGIPGGPGERDGPRPTPGAHTGRLGAAVGLSRPGGIPGGPCSSWTATTPLYGQLAGFFFRFFTFFGPGGYSCRYLLGMAKPPSTPGGVRQRTDTKLSRLSWTHPTRAETGFSLFCGGGCGAAAWLVYTRKGYSRKGSAQFLHPIMGELNIPSEPQLRP